MREGTASPYIMLVGFVPVTEHSISAAKYEFW